MSTERELHIRSIIHSIPLCGCGSTNTMWAIVRDMLRRAKAHTEGPKEASVSFYDPMPERHLSATATEFVAHVLGECDLLEHGSSIAWAWLTKAGAMLLEFLEEYPDANAWPAWAFSCPVGETFAMTSAEMRAAGFADHYGGGA